MRRSLTPVRCAAAEQSSAKTVSPEGSDSGYGSTGNITDASTTDQSQDFADGVALRPRRMFERKVTKLRLFDREIPQLTQHRFHDLHELFERPLCDHLIGAKINPYPISLKLKVLGESEATAKPWIVVLCNKAAFKRVRHFFNQQQIKAYYQPSNPDTFLPSFEIFVCNRPPRPMAGIEVYGDFDQRTTMCGSIIKVGEADQSRFATLGGVIKVIKPSGAVLLYGMTAGHILAEQLTGHYSFDQVDISHEEEDEDEGFYSGEEEYELDDLLDDDEPAQNSASGTGGFSQKIQLGRMWQKIGSVSATSNKETATEHDHDWALIDFDRVTDYRPNLLVSLDGDDKAMRNRPLKENGKATEDGSSRKVLLLSGTEGVKTGMLSTSLSYLMMGPAKAFTKTYTLRMPHGSVLNAGDCGSWVVDQSTCEVYGHVVASDAMGDTYVVPLNRTLRDMEEKLGAAVFLPTEADIHTWLAQHAKVAAEEVALPAASKKKKVAFNDFKIDQVDLSRNVQELAGHSSSQASASVIPLFPSISTPIADYCTSCNAKFEGSSQDVRSNLSRHRRVCSKQNEHPTSGIGTPTSQSTKDLPDESSKSTSVKKTRTTQQKATNHTSTQQLSPVPWSIRSMYSSLRKKPGDDSQQKDKSTVKSVGNSGNEKAASSTKSVVTTSPTLTTKESKKSAKESNSRKDWVSPPLSKNMPAPSSSLAGSISGDFSPGPTSGPKSSFLPAASPSLPHLRQGRRLSAPSAPHPAPQPVHGHKSSHENSSDLHHHSHASNVEEISYDGYTFTKCKSNHAGQKDTWAVAQMVPMPVSQKDLKDQIKRNRKRHTSALDEYNDERMKGFKRKQVDNLIRECTKVDGDYGYEYVLASIKLDSRITKNKTYETLSMQVILKRQMIAGFSHETSAGPSMDVHARLPSQVMDLTREDELGISRDYGSRSQVVGPLYTDAQFHGYQEHRVFPIPPGPGQSFSYGVPLVNNGPPIFQPAAPQALGLMYPPAQVMRQPPLPLPLPPPPAPLPLHRAPAVIRQENRSYQGNLGKAHKFNQDKKGHGSRNEYHDSSNSSSSSVHSFGLDSEGSWTKTDATPDTLISDQSSGNSKEKQHYEKQHYEKQHYEEQHYRKESKEVPHNKIEIHSTPSTHKIERPVYREHRKKEHRRYSLSPARRPRDASVDSFDLRPERHGWSGASARKSYDTRYRDYDSYEIEPAISYGSNRSFGHRGSSVSPERLSIRRVSGYDSDDPQTHSSRAMIPVPRPPVVYQESGWGFPRGVDPYDLAAERRREEERWNRTYDLATERRRVEEIRNRARIPLGREEDERTRVSRELERQEKRKEKDRKGDVESMRERERRGSGLGSGLIRRDTRVPRVTYDDGDDRYIPRASRYTGYYR